MGKEECQYWSSCCVTDGPSCPGDHCPHQTAHRPVQFSSDGLVTAVLCLKWLLCCVSYVCVVPHTPVMWLLCCVSSSLSSSSCIVVSHTCEMCLRLLCCTLHVCGVPHTAVLYIPHTFVLGSWQWVCCTLNSCVARLCVQRTSHLCSLMSKWGSCGCMCEVCHYRMQVEN